MGHNNGVITSPVTTEDIRQTLGLASRQVGYLCSNEHGMTNKWSRYKPVWYPGYISDIKIAYKAKYSGLAPGLHSDGDCGLAPSNHYYYTGTAAEKAELIKKTTLEGWDYAAPLGNVVDAYGHQNICRCKMLDFVGYNHNAVPPMYLPKFNEERTINNAAEKYVYYRLNFIESDTREGNIGFDDLAQSNFINFKNVTIIAVLFRYNGEIEQFFESDRILDEEGNFNDSYIAFDVTKLAYANNYKIYMSLLHYIPDQYVEMYPLMNEKSDIVASFPLTLNIITDAGGGGASVANWATDVYVAPATVVSTADKSMLKLFYEACEEGNPRYYMTNEDYDMSLRIKFTNTSNTAKTFDRTNFKLRTEKYPSGKMSDSMRNESLNTITGFTVPANGSVWITFTYENVLPSINVSSGGNNYQGSEINFERDNIWLFGGLLYHHNGAEGWHSLT